MKNTKNMCWAGLAAIVIVATLAFAAVAFAGGSAGTNIDWWVFGGGGGSAGGGAVTIDSTLGQPMAGVSSGGNVSGCAGYWCSEQPALIYLPLVRH